MNFIDDKDLSRRFKEGKVSPREKFLYFFIGTILGAMLSSHLFSKTVSASADTWEIVADVVTIAAIVVGTLICYGTNRRGDDKDFIERIICIGFPVFVRMMIVLVLLGGIHIVVSFFFSDVDLFGYPSLLSFDVIGMGYFYWRLNTSIGIAAG